MPVESASKPSEHPPADISSLVDGGVANTTPSPVPTRPDFLPDNYWDGEKKAVNLERLVYDVKKYREALSRKNQEIPANPDGYTLDGVQLPDDLKAETRTFAHNLELSKFQADQLFGEDAEKLGTLVSAHISKREQDDVKAHEQEYQAREIASFGGEDRVKDAVKRMDNFIHRGEK